MLLSQGEFGGIIYFPHCSDFSSLFMSYLKFDMDVGGFGRIASDKAAFDGEEIR